MVDVTRVPENAFGYVPTPALVAPIEFTLRLSDYAALGGHMDHVRPLASLGVDMARRQVPGHRDNPWPFAPEGASGRTADADGPPPQIALLPDGRRLHLQDGPIDLIVEAIGDGGGGAAPPMRRRRGASPACSTNCATSWRCCARRLGRPLPAAGPGRAAHA